MTLGLFDKRSRDVTWRVWSSVHRTSSVNSTEHSGQKSSQVQSCRRIKYVRLKLVFYICTGSGVNSRELVYYTDDWYNSAFTLEYCILSTMSSLVRGMRPDDKRQCCYYQTSLGTLQHYINHNVLHWKLIITLGYIPTLCATNSSWSTDELASIWIQSIAAKKVMQV